MITDRTRNVLVSSLAALLLVLCLSAALSQPALAKLTIDWDAGTGTLTVTSDGDDEVIIKQEQYGGVLVSGVLVTDGNGDSVHSHDVRKIVVNGGPGDNLIDLQDVNRGAFASLRDNQIFLYGNDGHDRIIGSTFADEMEGGEGHDHLEGGFGKDVQFGGPGHDVLMGGADSDVQIGDQGDDTILEGPGSADVVSDTVGNDTIDFSPAHAAIIFDLDLQGVDQAVDAAGNTVRLEGQVENLVGSAFADVVSVDPLTVPRGIDGGAPPTTTREMAGAGGQPGDVLSFDARHLPWIDTGGAIHVQGYAPVTYTNFAVVNVVNGKTGAHIDPDEGGTIVYTDAQGLTTTISVPPGALVQTATLAYTPRLSPTHPLSPGVQFAGHAFDLELLFGPEPAVISVVKTADPGVVAAPGGDVAFTALISNASPVYSVTLSSLMDDPYGDVTDLANSDLLGSDCELATLPPRHCYRCTFTATVSGGPGEVLTDTLVVSGTDGGGNPVYASDQASVTVHLVQIYLPLVMRGPSTDLQHVGPVSGGAVPAEAGVTVLGSAGPYPCLPQLRKPITITIHYSDADVEGIDENDLRLYRWTGSAWEDAATTCSPPSTYVRDVDANVLRVPVCHLSRFALGG
jgi:hypothetical protein